MPSKEEAMFIEAFQELEEEEEGFFANFAEEIKTLKPAKKSIQRDFERFAAENEAARKAEEAKTGADRVAADSTGAARAPVTRAAAKKAGPIKIVIAEAAATKVVADKASTAKAPTKKDAIAKTSAVKTSVAKVAANHKAK